MMKRLYGFTLLEVLVALAVLAIAMAAVIKVSVTNTSNTIYLKEKTIAHWVAVNKANEIRATGNWPSTGHKKGNVFMARQEWRWQLKVSNTPDKNIRRMDIEVQHVRELGGKAAITAFIGRPLK